MAAKPPPDRTDALKFVPHVQVLIPVEGDPVVRLICASAEEEERLRLELDLLRFAA